MSSTLQEVLARVQELTPQAPAAAVAPAPAAAVSGSTDFSDVLDVANGAGATANGSVPASYTAAIDAAGQRYGVDPDLLQSVIQQESGFNPYATSAAGAQGLMQLMPSTASSLGVTDPYDPYQSIDAGARYLSSKLNEYGGNTSLALAAYNAGSGAVARYGGIPPYPETQNYVQSVLGHYQQLVNDGSAQ